MGIHEMLANLCVMVYVKLLCKRFSKTMCTFRSKLSGPLLPSWIFYNRFFEGN